MYEYKVFKWILNLNSAEDLETELNNYAKDRWRIFKIINDSKLSGSAMCGTSTNTTLTIILEREK